MNDVVLAVTKKASELSNARINFSSLNIISLTAFTPFSSNQPVLSLIVRVPLRLNTCLLPLWKQLLLPPFTYNIRPADSREIIHFECRRSPKRNAKTNVKFNEFRRKLISTYGGVLYMRTEVDWYRHDFFYDQFNTSYIF